MGGALKLAAMVRESLAANRRYDKAGNGFVATVPNILVKALSLYMQADILTAVVPTNFAADV